MSANWPEKQPLIHPGEILEEEFLRSMNITQYCLAKAIGVDALRVHAIVNGERGISAEAALLFWRFFGDSAEISPRPGDGRRIRLWYGFRNREMPVFRGCSILPVCGTLPRCGSCSINAYSRHATDLRLHPHQSPAPGGGPGDGPLDHIHRCHSCLGDILSEQLTRTFTLADGYLVVHFPAALDSGSGFEWK